MAQCNPRTSSRSGLARASGRCVALLLLSIWGSVCIGQPVSILGQSRTTHELVPIANLDATPSLEDGTEFGPLDTTDGRSQDFLLQNSGAVPLQIFAIRAEGWSASDFNVDGSQCITINFLPGAICPFSVVLNPTAAGLYQTDIVIYAHDESSHYFRYRVQGEARWTDMQISLTNQQSRLYSGSDDVYSLTVQNVGDYPSSNALISLIPPGLLQDVVWTCVSEPAGLCPEAAGDGFIYHTLPLLPAHANLHYEIIVRVIDRPPPFLTVTAAIEDLQGNDINRTNNVAMDSDTVILVGLFADDFE